MEGDFHETDRGRPGFPQKGCLGVENRSKGSYERLDKEFIKSKIRVKSKIEKLFLPVQSPRFQ